MKDKKKDENEKQNTEEREYISSVITIWWDLVFMSDAKKMNNQSKKCRNHTHVFDGIDSNCVFLLSKNSYKKIVW